MNVLIPVEISSRELLYKIYLSHYLAENGFKCYLGNKSYINRLIDTFEQYIYLDKGYHKGQSEILFKKIKENKGIIINLDEEGGVDFSDGSTLLGRYAKPLFDLTDLVLFWGKSQYNLISKNFKINSKTAIVGHPRFELLSDKYRYLYQSEIDEIKDKFQNFILINTNMSFGNNIRGDQFVRKNYKSRFKDIEKIIISDKKKLEAYCSLVNLLSKKVDENIIIRPHPEEKISFYHKRLTKLKNVKIIYKGSVIPWLMSSKFMIHPDCTTAIEYLFSNNTPISFLPQNYDKNFVTELPTLASKCFTSESELVSYICNDEKKEKFDRENFPFAEKYFSISKPSIELIVNEFCKIRDNQKNFKNNNLKTKDFLFFKSHEIIKKIKHENNSIRLSLNKLKGFNKNYIKRIHDQIILNDDSVNSVSYKSINNHLYVFRK